MFLEPFSVPLIDCRGRVQRIRSLALADRRWWLALRLVILERCHGQDFRTVYDSDPLVRSCVDECLQLCGLSPGDVDAYQVTRLLIGLGDEPALLMQLNFPAEPAGEGDDDAKIPDRFDPQAYQIASLWGATENLEQALAIAREQPWREVAAILQARNHQVIEANPELRKKAKQKERLQHSRRRMAQLAQSGKLDQFLRHDDAEQQRTPGSPRLAELPDDYFPG